MVGMILWVVLEYVAYTVFELFLCICVFVYFVHHHNFIRVMVSMVMVWGVLECAA